MSAQLNRSIHIRVGAVTGTETLQEQCKMLFDFLGWTYDFLFEEMAGHVNISDPKASTGSVLCIASLIYEFQAYGAN